MNTRFLVPATVALAIHGGLFFGFPRSPRAASFLGKEPELPGCVFEFPRDEIEIVSASPDEPILRKGEPIERPPSPEPVSVKPDIDQPVMPRPPVDAGPIGDTKRIVEFGDPHGDVRSRITSNNLITGLQLDNPPRTRFQAAPIYPPEKRRLGETGEVWVEFDVDESGLVHRPRVTKSSDRAFEEPTLRAVAKWRFEPGKRHGVVVPFRMTVPVIFSLNE